MRFVRSVLLLVGTTLGAGIFALPYFFAQSGWLPSLLGIILLTSLTVAINIYYAQVVLATSDGHQLGYYAQKYLGNKARLLALLALGGTLSGAILIYTILGGSFLTIIFPSLSPFMGRLLFLTLALFAFQGHLRRLSIIEAILTAFLIILALSFPILGFRHFQPKNLSLLGSHPLAFYGPLLFALSGLTIIPEMKEILQSRQQILIKAITSGTIIVALINLIFSFSVWALVKPTNDILIALQATFPTLGILAAIMGVLSCFTSFLGLSEVLNSIFQEIGLSLNQAHALNILIPLAGLFLPLAFLGDILDFSGALGLGIINILVILIYWRLKKGRLSFWLLLTLLFFILGLAEPFRHLF